MRRDPYPLVRIAVGSCPRENPAGVGNRLGADCSKDGRAPIGIAIEQEESTLVVESSCFGDGRVET